jgi:hypothetical protein
MKDEFVCASLSHFGRVLFDDLPAIFAEGRDVLRDYATGNGGDFTLVLFVEM